MTGRAGDDRGYGGAERPGRATLVLLLVWFGTAAANVAVVDALSGGEEINGFVMFLVTPVSVLAAMVAWQGLAVMALLPRLLGVVRGRRSRDELPRAARAELERRAGVMLPVCSGIALVASVVLALLPGTDFLVTVVAYTAFGTAVGWLLVRLARAGLLPLFEG